MHEKKKRNPYSMTLFMVVMKHFLFFIENCGSYYSTCSFLQLLTEGFIPAVSGASLAGNWCMCVDVYMSK